MARRSTSGSISAASSLVVTVLIVAVLYLGRDVLMPLALAILLSFLLSPIVRMLERCRLGNVLSVMITAFFAFLLLAGCLWILGSEISQIVQQLPQYRQELVAKARNLSGMGMGSNVGKEIDQLAADVQEAMEGKPAAEGARPGDAARPGGAAVEDGPSPASADEPAVVERPLESEAGSPNLPLAERMQAAVDDWFGTRKTDEKVNDGKTPQTPLYISEVRGGPLSLVSWAGSVGTVLGPIGTAGLVVVFTLFMLAYRDDLRDRVIKVISRGDYVTTTEAIDEATHRISRFLMAQFLVNTTYGITIGFGLFLIGRLMTAEGTFPNYALWGFLCIVLRFLPYVGPILASVFPLAISIAVFPGYSVFLAVLTLIIVVELVSNNLMEPWLYGASTGISAMAVIFSAVFWGWLWGPVGLLLATPLTVCLVVLGRHVAPFRMFATLLSEEIPVPAYVRFYQRLLAADPDKALNMLREYENQQDRLAAMDEVVVPAIRRIRIDSQRALLDPQDSLRLLASVDEVLDHVESSAQQLNDAQMAKEPPPTQEALKRPMAQQVQASQSADQTAAAQPAPQDESAATLTRCIAIPAHHPSEELALRALRSTLGADRFLVQIASCESIPLDIAIEAAEAKPAVTIIGVVPPGGFAQARFLCKQIRRQGYGGPIIVMCIGHFKYYDRLFVRFRRSGGSYMTTTVEQTHKKIHMLATASQGSPQRTSAAKDAGAKDSGDADLARAVAAISGDRTGE